MGFLALGLGLVQGLLSPGVLGLAAFCGVESVQPDISMPEKSQYLSLYRAFRFLLCRQTPFSSFRPVHCAT